MSLVFTYGAIGLHATQRQFRWQGSVDPIYEAVRTGILILSPEITPLTRYASRFLVSIQVAGWIARVYILVLLLRPVVLRHRQEGTKW